MPAGVDFVCKNDDCKYCNSGFVMTAPWPMGDINKIIDAPNVVNHKEFREGLLKLKTEGRKYACITYPNLDETEMESYRVHKWCQKCTCLWTYDAPVSDVNKSISEVLEEANLPNECPTCNTELMDFNDVVEGGINCPFCKEEMSNNSWFCNETIGEII